MWSGTSARETEDLRRYRFADQHATLCIGKSIGREKIVWGAGNGEVGLGMLKGVVYGGISNGRRSLDRVYRNAEFRVARCVDYCICATRAFCGGEARDTTNKSA